MACDIKTEPALPNSVTIYKPEARDIMRHFAMLNNPKCWHRLAIINCVKHSRHQVLKAVADAVYPYDFLPVLYQTLKVRYPKRKFYYKRAYILVRNCTQAIIELCRRNLTVPNPYTPERPIERLSELSNLRNFELTDLWLEGNPFCAIYDGLMYVKEVKQKCTKLERLDGITLRPQGEFLAYRRNYLCNVKAVKLVDQFLKHFFTIYDEDNRNVLEDLYDKNAMFSLVAYYIPGQDSSPYAQLKTYNVISRNLQTLADFSKSSASLHVGNTTIVNVLSELPRTQHDPYTFTVDLVAHNDKYSILTVSGVFKELADSLVESDRIMGFFRTFVLKAGRDGEYNILNDMLAVANATSSQQRRAFRVTKVPTTISLPPARTEEEMKEMAEAFKQITTLNLSWSKKCLEECRYDLKESLKLFVGHYESDKLPEEAFIEV